MPQKDEFFMYGVTSLGWFMLDGMYRAVLANYAGRDPELEVCVPVAGGGALALPDGLELPADQPYMGSAFFSAHEGTAGGDPQDAQEDYAGTEWRGSRRGGSGAVTPDITGFSVNRQGIANFSFTFNARDGRSFEGVAAAGEGLRTAGYMDLESTTADGGSGVSVSLADPREDSASRRIWVDVYPRAGN
jgi:hypothetical protein